MENETTTIEFQCWLDNCIRDAKSKLRLSDSEIRWVLSWKLQQLELSNLVGIKMD